GINAGNKKVINVANGVQAKDAVNVSQLNSASAAARTKVLSGTNVASVDFSTDSITGQDIYTVNADGTTASAGSSAVTVTQGAKDAATNMTDYAVDLSDASKASLVKADSAMQSVVTQIDGTDVKTLSRTDNSANFLTGDNIVLTAEGGGIKVATAPDVSFTTVTTGNSLLNTNGLSIIGGPTFTATGINANNQQIQGVASGGTTVSNAANIGDVNTAITGVTNLGFGLKAADGNTVQKPLGQAVEVVGSNNNIDTRVNNGKVEVQLNDNLDLGNNGSVKMGSGAPFGLGSTTTLDRSGLTTGNALLNTTVDGLGVRTGNALINTTVSSLGVAVSNPFSTTTLSGNGLNILGGPSVTTAGINAGNKKVINVANGVQAKDAVNVSQLNSASAAARTKVLSGTNVASVDFSTDSITGQDIYTVNADGTTASAGSSAVTVTQGAKDAATNMTDYAVDLSDASKASLVKADSAMQSVVTQIDGTDVKTLSRTDNSANFLTGDNIVLTAEGGGIKVATAPDVSFTTVTTGNSLLNTEGVRFLGGSSVRLSQSGLNNGGNRITNVADGADDTDGVNVRQLNGVSEIANKGWDISAQGNSATASNVGPGESVDFNSKNSNIIVSKDTTSNDVSFKLNDNLDLGNNGSVSTGNAISGTSVNRLGIVTGGLLAGGVTTVSGAGVSVTSLNPFNPTSAALTSDGLTILNGPSVTKSGGINAGNKKVINVANGVQAKDAVNVSQLNSASAAARTKVLSGTNVASVDFSTDSITGQDIYTVNADGTTASAGSSAVTVTQGAKDAATNMTDYAVDLSDASKASLVKADSAMQSVVTQIDGTDVKTLSRTDNSANFLTGDNIVLTAEGGGIKVATAPDVSFTTVTTGNSLLNTNGLSIIGGPTFTATGINANNQQIQGVASGGTTVSNAANIGDVNTAITGVTNLGFGLKAADGNTVQKPLGQAVEVVGSNNNIDTRVNNGKVEVQLNDNLDLGNNGSVKMGSGAPFGLGSTTTLDRSGLTTGNALLNTTVDGLGVRTGNALINTTVSSLGVAVSNPFSTTTLSGNGLNILGGPSVTTAGINAGNKKVINVANGVQAKDAVNVSQLNSASAAARTKVLSGTNVASVDFSTDSITGQDIYTVNADGTTASAGSSAVTVTQGAKDAATNMTDYAVDLSDASKASLVKADSAMQSVVTQIDGTDVKTLSRTDNSANFLTGDNIVLTAEGGGIKVATAPDVSFTTVTTGNSLLNTEGVRFLGGSSVRLSQSGLNNGGNRITNVADGADDTDGVNVRQLKATNSTVDLGLDFTGDDTAVIVNRKLGQTLTIQGGATTLTDNNIGVV
ncbi:MAG: beta strand repeat-containing protein, partial [Psychrobacter alimentarius]